MLNVLRIRDFRLLWAAGLVSSLGSWLLVLAVPAHVYEVTKSITATGFTLAAEYLPLLLLGPAAGALTDRWDRRQVLIAADLFRVVVVLAMLVALSPGRYWIFYVMLAAESSGTVLFLPAVRAQTPAIVGTDTALNSASALNALASGVTRLAGGPLGGILLAYCGIRVLICADAASYLVSAVLIMALSSSSGVAMPRATVRAVLVDLRDGVRYLRGLPPVRALLPVTVIYLAANASLSAVLIPFGVQHLGGSRQTGLLFAALGIGFLIGAPLLKLLLDRVPGRYLLCGTLTGNAAGYAALFWSSSLQTALPAAVCIGLFGSMSLMVPQTLTQRLVAEHMLGRVSAVFLTAEAAATLCGAMAGPALAGVAQVTGLAAVASSLTLIAAGLAFVLCQDLARQHHGPRPLGWLAVGTSETIAGIEPFDEMERVHQADALAWLACTRDIYRRVKPATPSPHLVAYAVLADTRDWSLFLVDHRLSGLWLPPGGHVEPGEEPAAAARREAREELGITVDPGQWPVFVTVTDTRPAAGDESHTDVSLWYVLAGSRELQLTLDMREFAGGRWWSPAEIEAADPGLLDPHMSRFLAKMRRPGPS
jgi:8-oxo-dGTP pyrophosphatase MutT (NUDIX family)/MFS family permease